MLPVPLLLLGAVLAEPEAWHRYDVHVDEQLTRLETRACFADGLPHRLVADHPVATEATIEFRQLRDGKVVTARPSGHAIILPRPSDDDCIEWTTDLDVIAGARRVDVGYRSGASLVMTSGAWFWRPVVLTRTRDIEFTFHLPPGMHVSAPWKPLADTQAAQRFRYGDSPLYWSSMIAIGRLNRHDFEIGETRFRLGIADGKPAVDSQRVLDWLQPAAVAVTQLWGTFPVRDVQLLVVPVADGYDAAPWAQTNRGGGAGAHFYMNAGAAPEVFLDDWIATHELAHFALPFVHRDDAWLAEGFASYYQNVLRARAGMITPQEAWQDLLDGFARGNRDTENDTLRDDTLYMHSRGRVLRVYWSGAAIALLADVQLRTRTHGEWSLDRVLAEFHRCCRQPERAWSARELFAKFDALAGTDIFDALYRQNVYSRHFPRLAETLANLGIEDIDGRASLHDEARLEDVRRDIMSPLPGSNPAANAAGKITSR